MNPCRPTSLRPTPELLANGAALTPRQRELAALLAALLVADFKANPPATVGSPTGHDRE